jgi:hypothetical protein
MGAFVAIGVAGALRLLSNFCGVVVFSMTTHAISAGLCGLDGLNPAFHPDIFGNPAIAKSYGLCNRGVVLGR